jgi:GAF domain-containing protein
VEAQLLHDVNEVSAILIQTPGKPGDLKSVLQHIAQIAHDSFATDACVILAFNPITGGFLGSQVVGNLHAENELLHDRPRPKGVTQQVLDKEDGVVLIEDLELEPQYHNPFTHREGFRAFAGLSLQTRHRKRPLGVIYLDFRQPKTFSPAERESYRIFAVQAAFLLQEAWLAHHYEEIARIGQDVNHNLATADELFQELQRYVNTVLDDSHTLILAIYQPQTKTLEVRLKALEYHLFLNRPLEGACKYVIETQKSLYIPQLSKEKAQLPFQIINISGTEEKESHIFVPLTLRGVSLGVLSIQHRLPEAYGQEDLFVLQLLANYIALAIHNMLLYSSLSQLNETGQLLTRLLESEQTLQATVDKIRDATLADLVVLYPYEANRHCFVLPPSTAGTLLDSTSIQSMSSTRPDDIVERMLHHEKPIFAKNTTVDTGQDSTTHIRQGSFGKRENIRSTAALPLRVGDELVGVLFANFRQPQRFDATQKLFIEGLAHYAAIAIKNAQVFGKLSLRRIHELEILQKIDRELNRSLDLESVLYTLLKVAQEHVPTEEASILLHNPQTQVLETAAAIGRYAEISRKQTVSLHETRGITRWVLEEKKPARVNNVHYELPWRDLHFPVAVDTISELDVPLLDGDEVIGVLNFESTREGAFSQEDQDFLITLAGQAVLAIKKAQAYEREKRLVEEGQVLNEISKEIISQLDLNHVFDLILGKALELTRSTTGNLMLYDRERKDLWMAAERGVAQDKKDRRQSLDEGVVGYAVRTKQLLNVDLSQPQWRDMNLDFIPGTCSELAVPMLAGNELRGVLNIESLSSNNFNESDERLLRGLADLAVIALQNAQAYEREKRLAQESQVLNEISKEITSQLDLTRVFDLILGKALELTHSVFGSLYLYDPHLNELHMVADRGVSEDKKGLRQKLGEGIVGLVAKQQRLQNVEDVTQTPWSKIYQEFFPGALSELAVPMLAGDGLRGVLNIESPSLNNFSESDERLLHGLADLAVVALQNAERYKEAEREAQRMKLLYQAGQELSKITDLEELEQAYEIVVQIADEQSQSQAVIYSLDETNTELMLKYKSSDRDAPLFERIKLDEGISGQVARERRTIVVRDADNLPPGIGPVKQSDPRMRSLVVTPVMFKDQYYGNLGLRHEAVSHFRRADILLYEGLAQLLASTIHRLETAKARQEFEQRALSAEEMSSIGQSAYEVTHRLGNDLGLVESYVGDIQLELESLGANSNFVTRKLENIVQSVRTVLDLSRELKQQLASLGATDEAAGEPIIISPKLLLEEAHAHTAPLLPLNIQIYTKIDAEVDNIRVIPGSIDDVLRNLIANAIHAMSNSGKITLRARNAGRYVALEVTDTGVGIPPEKQSKIFDLFFSTKGSSGFGLWSARRNVLKNHGQIKVESKPSQGTTFILLLPRINGEIREQHEALL